MKYACVTGAGRGVGFELVNGLLNEGYCVFAGIRKESPELNKLKMEFGDMLHIIEMDISNDDSVREASRYIEENTSSLDILINNGAILGDIDATVFDEIDFNEINKVINVNAAGALRVSNGLIKLVMGSQEKLIVNISSEAGSIGSCGRQGWFGYCMSKAALNMGSNLVHNGIKEAGGQVMVIHPGHVRTYMRGELDTTGALAPEESAEFILRLVKEHEKYKAEQAVFLDYLGNKMEW